MPPAQFYRLMDTMARMALRADASRYFLGYIWWVLEPLLYVAVFYVVFDILLDSGRADYLVFLMCGKLAFIWFSKSVNQASSSILANRGLIEKINVPKPLFPMAVVHEGLYKQAGVFALLIALLIAWGYTPSPVWWWLLPLVVVNYLMIIAASFVGACLVCLARDFAPLISLFMTFLMFVSGIFWDVRNLGNPQLTQLVLNVNPLAFMLDAYRQVLMYNAAPDIPHLALVGLGAALLVVVLVAGMNRASRYLALRVLSS